MKLQFRFAMGSFESSPCGDELPPLVIITGANGSGKTQLLRALHDGAMTGDWEHDGSQTLLLTSADLTMQNLHDSSGKTRRVVVDEFEAHVNQVIRPNGAFQKGSEEYLHTWLERYAGISPDALQRAEQRAGKRLKDWLRPDFEQHTPFEHGQSLLEMSISDTFQRYSAARTVNDFNRWLESQGKAHQPWVSDDAFVEVYGPEPWNLLNDIMSRLGLPYSFPAPSISIEEVGYSPRFESKQESLFIPPDQLSSGEVALVHIAMAVYSGLYRSDVTRVPRAVLLDEPDATLHPSMVRTMLQLLHEVLVEKLGLTVIMTTHSPTTVALAPDESIYLMERSGKERLKKVSRDEALRHLLVGVPTVSVSAEHRRVVFTESPHDVDRYTAIFSALRPRIDSERTLTFVAAGTNKGDGNGCAAVISIVDKLRGNGNLSVWGLVDRDDRTAEPNRWVLFNEERYAIENIILDPLSVGLLLLLDGEEETVAAVPSSTGLSFRTEDAQSLVDNILTRVLGPSVDSRRRVVTYRDGSDVSVDAAWLDMNGHALEELITERIPHLKRYSHNNRLATTVVERVWAQDFRRIPASVERTFLRLLEDDGQAS